MAIAITLQEYLQNHDLDYEEIDHRPTDSALMSSEAARIPGDRMAKSVLLGDDERYLLAVIPATHRLRLDQVERLTGRKFTLISEDELEDAFSDCEAGAVPPIGMPYGIETLVDSNLMCQPDIYCESGDHGKLLHMPARTFRMAEEDAIVAEIGTHL
ncbi:MAG: YbaK/EbsC family protein [Candidatus Thiodiazotropha sp. (ex Myrtea spinifera)]|nr:YbaK/EbsC family protein [Candidatus Thiodiazotropha sp. (ex Myrtea spinifera)]MCU7830794.1 YbaK/EbsC family protein [Candidatus Thiodiazotropha sp. (ex Myrtea sp. 'scaly one' KF741663)]